MENSRWKERQQLSDFKIMFKKHYGQVIAFGHVASALKLLVGEFSDILAESVNGDDKNMKRKVHILKEMQSAKNQQYMLIHDSAKDLDKRLTDILESYNMPPPDISNSPENSPENMNRTQKQSVRSNADDQIQNESQQTENATASKDYSSENKDLKEQVSELKRTNERLVSKNVSLKEEILKLRPPEGIDTVQLFHSHGGNTIKEIEEDLKEEMHRNKVKLTNCNNLGDVDPSKTLIILSIITSRVGTDATNAIKDIKNPASTVLVLIHIKDDHALPSHGSSSILTGETFKALGGIFDIAFVHGKGIYPCEMNDAAIEGIYSFIKQNLQGTIQ